MCEERREGYHAHGRENAPPGVSTLIHKHGPADKDHVHKVLFADRWAYKEGTVTTAPADYWVDYGRLVRLGTRAPADYWVDDDDGTT